MQLTNSIIYKGHALYFSDRFSSNVSFSYSFSTCTPSHCSLLFCTLHPEKKKKEMLHGAYSFKLLNRFEIISSEK